MAALDSTPVVASTTASSTESTGESASSTEDTESSTQDTGSPGDDPNFPESETLAVTFVDLMAAGQYDSAHFLLCEDGRDASDGDGFADGQALADDFFGFLGATSVVDFQVTDVHVDPDDSTRDIVWMDIDTDAGSVPVDFSMLEESGTVTICGYDIS